MINFFILIAPNGLQICVCEERSSANVLLCSRFAWAGITKLLTKINT